MLDLEQCTKRELIIAFNALTKEFNYQVALNHKLLRAIRRENLDYYICDDDNEIYLTNFSTIPFRRLKDFSVYADVYGQYHLKDEDFPLSDDEIIYDIRG